MKLPMRPRPYNILIEVIVYLQLEYRRLWSVKRMNLGGGGGEMLAILDSTTVFCFILYSIEVLALEHKNLWDVIVYQDLPSLFSKIEHSNNWQNGLCRVPTDPTDGICQIASGIKVLENTCSKKFRRSYRLLKKNFFRVRITMDN